MSTSWEGAFAAVSALLGEPVDAIEASLGDAGALRAADVLRGLRAPARETRARAIARTVSELAVDLERMKLA
jgi:hypothetical protein